MISHQLSVGFRWLFSWFSAKPKFRIVPKDDQNPAVAWCESAARRESADKHLSMWRVDTRCLPHSPVVDRTTGLIRESWGLRMTFRWLGFFKDWLGDYGFNQHSRWMKETTWNISVRCLEAVTLCWITCRLANLILGIPVACHFEQVIR